MTVKMQGDHYMVHNSQNSNHISQSLWSCDKGNPFFQNSWTEIFEMRNINSFIIIHNTILYPWANKLGLGKHGKYQHLSSLDSHCWCMGLSPWQYIKCTLKDIKTMQEMII